MGGFMTLGSTRLIRLPDELIPLGRSTADAGAIAGAPPLGAFFGVVFKLLTLSLTPNVSLSILNASSLKWPACESLTHCS